MKITVLGSGTSHGIPVIGCDCPVCNSNDPKDKRTRASILVSDEKTNILVDCGPEFRIQALREHITSIDSVLLTHSHADHLHGIDDLRVFSCQRTVNDIKKTSEKPLPVYANTETYSDFKTRFDYLFQTIKQGGGYAFIDLQDTSHYSVNNPLKIGNFEIIPVPLKHGFLNTSGYIFHEKDSEKSLVYLTDCNYIPDDSLNLIKTACKNPDLLIIDGLRIRPHSTHFNFDQALEASERIKAKQTFFTHLCHDCTQTAAEEYIAEHISNFPYLSKSGTQIKPCWDGLKLIIDN